MIDMDAAEETLREAQDKIETLIAFWKMCVTLCGRFDPDEGGTVGCVDGIGAKYAVKRGVQMAGMNVQTHSRFCDGIALL